MTKQHTTWLSGIAGLSLALAGGMVACSKPAGPSADLAQDLQAASSNSASALTLAPTSSGRRDVISAVEQSPEARRVHLASRVTPLPPPPAAAVPQPVTPPVVPTTAVAAIPSTTSPEAAKPSTSKRPTQMQSAQTGRYKTVAEVIRNAPFPINP